MITTTRILPRTKRRPRRAAAGDEARIVKFEGVARFQASGRSPPFEDHHDPDSDDPDELDEDLWALVDQRIGLLPLGGDAALPTRLGEEEAVSVA